MLGLDTSASTEQDVSFGRILEPQSAGRRSGQQIAPGDAHGLPRRHGRHPALPHEDRAAERQPILLAAHGQRASHAAARRRPCSRRSGRRLAQHAARGSCHGRRPGLRRIHHRRRERALPHHLLQPRRPGHQLAAQEADRRQRQTARPCQPAGRPTLWRSSLPLHAGRHNPHHLLCIAQEWRRHCNHRRHDSRRHHRPRRLHRQRLRFLL